MELLTKILEAGAEQDETAAIHVLMILSLLAESVNGEPLLTNRLCSVLVKTLGKSTSGELSELCVELIHGQAENSKYPIKHDIPYYKVVSRLELDCDRVFLYL